MSDPMYPPPPPPSMPPPMPPPGGGNAAQMVQGPSIGLLVTGALGILGALLSLVMNLLGTGMSAMPGMDMGGDAAGRYMSMMSGGVGIVAALLSLALYGFVIWGALQMKQLRGWNISMAASIAAMLPCSCCCIIGLPIGIWALVVLLKPEVKSAFSG
jgi:hypothetical protein